MKRVFVSQPMRNISENKILLARERAREAISKAYEGEDIIFIDSYFEGGKFGNPIRYLGKSIQKMANADIAYFCEGWRNARGCWIEHHVAVAYGITVMEEVNDEDE